VSTGVDYLTFRAGKSGTPPVIAVAGSTTNQDININPKGSGAARITAEGIVTGHPSMPEFRLDPGQIGDVIAYLNSLER